MHTICVSVAIVLASCGTRPILAPARLMTYARRRSVNQVFSACDFIAAITHQDRSGRLWRGGWQGLFRYDGETIIRVGKDGPWEVTKPR